MRDGRPTTRNDGPDPEPSPLGGQGRVRGGRATTRNASPRREVVPPPSPWKGEGKEWRSTLRRGGCRFPQVSGVVWVSRPLEAGAGAGHGGRHITPGGTHA